MSKKRKLESLQQLGILKASEVKQVQAALGQPKVEAYNLRFANVRWASLAFVVGGSYAALVALLGVAWRLSH